MVNTGSGVALEMHHQTDNYIFPRCERLECFESLYDSLVITYFILKFVSVILTDLS